MSRSSGRSPKRLVSLQHRLPLLMTVLLAALLTATIGLAYREVRGSAVVAWQERLDRLSRQMAETVQGVVDQRLALIRTAAEDDAVRALLSTGVADEGALRSRLGALRTPADAAFPIEVWPIGSTAPAYQLAGSSSPLPRDSADFPSEGGYGRWFRYADRTVAFLAAPVRDGVETIGHVVQLRTFGSPETAASMADLLGTDASVYVLAGADRWGGLDGELTVAPGVEVASGPLTYSRDGTRFLAHAAILPETPWIILVEYPLARVLERAGTYLRRSIVLLLGMIGLGAAGIWVLSRRFTGPVRSLGRAAESIAEGDYTHRVTIERDDELGAVAASFNTMADQVQVAHEDLRREVEQATGLAAELETANRRLKELMEEATQAQRAAEDASLAKSRFLATISHELRTPINAIVGYTDLLLLGIPQPATPDQVAHLERLRRNGRHLTRLIDDILDLAKIEAGQLHINEDVGPAEDALASVVSILGGLAADKNIELRSAWDPSGATLFRADMRRVEQILVNLLGNAIKFTQPGGVVTLRCRADTPAGGNGSSPSGLVHMSVEDTGIGIPAEKHEIIFDRFVQGDSSFRRGHEGAGLGLSISRELARRMGGEITVRSEEGVGSCFTLSLPATDEIPVTIVHRPLASMKDPTQSVA